MNDTKYWLWLSMVFGGALGRLWQLMSFYETAAEAYHELRAEKSECRLNEKEKNNIKAYSVNNAEEIIKICGKKGIGIVDYSSEDYPVHLRYISDPPPVLFYKGDIRCVMGRRAVTSVGTRNAGNYSLSAARRICSELASKGVVIISGFAKGIDIASHMAAADIGRPTVCVLGCGIDVDYPRENIVFRDKIIKSGGVFISEFPPGTQPMPANFPRRNRILSALSFVTIIFEASTRSGSLITAKLALEQGREIFVLPPADIFSRSFSGNSMLLREGAYPLLDHEDILDYFKDEVIASEIKSDAFTMVRSGSSYHKVIKNIDEPDEQEEYDEEDDMSSDALDILPEEDSDSETETDVPLSEESVENEGAENPIDLSEFEEGLQRDIVKLLMEEGTLHADVIAIKSGADAAELMTELTELEISGVIKAYPGRQYGIRS